MQSRWLLVLLLGVNFSSLAAGTPAPCSTPEYRQLDFWLGNWDTFNPDGSGPSQARNHVDAILGGCAIHERYEQGDGLTGESFSIYDATRQVWHQTWVTNRGSLLVLEGRFRAGALTLEGKTTDKDGKPMLIRGTWKAQADGVRETVVNSKDGGKTWDPYFDILFKPHR